MPSQPKTIETKTVQDKAPWTPAQPYYQDIYAKTQEALNKTNNNPFQGQFIAQPGQDAQAGLASMRGAAGNGAFAQGVEGFTNMANQTAAGNFLSPDSNPFIRQVVDAAARPMQQNFQNTVLPGITDQSIAQGAYGGARQDISQERAANDLSRQIGDMSSNIFYQNYNNERQNQINASSMLGQAFDLGQLPGQTMMGVDQQARQLQQLALDEQQRQVSEQRTAPWYGLGEAAQILSQGGFSTINTNTTAPNPNYVDPFTNILKIGLGGASSLAGLGGTGGFGWWGGKK